MSNYKIDTHDTQKSFDFEWLDENGAITTNDVNSSVGILTLGNLSGSAVASTWWTTSTSYIDPIEGKIEELTKTVKAMAERFAIIAENIEAHEEHKMLRDAYEKYKMVEKLIGKKKNE